MLKFDLISYLESRRLPYSTSGKNVTAGWIEISCPFCSSPDPSRHLGINLDSFGLSCWRCGFHGTIYDLIKKLERISPKEIFTRYPSLIAKKPAERVKAKEVKLPENASLNIKRVHYDYLTSRRFDPVELMGKYDLMFTTYTDHPFSWKIIVPVYFKQEMVTYVAMATTQNASQRYTNAPVESSKLTTKECLYNFDSVQSYAVIVEGITDVWRIGDGAVALFGKKYTSEQVNLLKRVKKVFVMLDADASKTNKNLARELSLFTDVSIVELDKGDPDDLPSQIVLKWRAENLPGNWK